ncbi:hypothetical protein BDB00DRAFT_874343 [Zychaea mexicana]|uniref:uncharacterized protein n=1 Tax=Zychaea mexicana TaxID=64656 RepID=UPI0022FE5910|nr:uncharacterized protein BDB00DRAFT_874343 [Zychaea mexicana]KAI9491450.1 hypothetical protein BDB00DRAFT_874343 [Zychaea mexicana]
MLKTPTLNNDYINSFAPHNHSGSKTTALSDIPLKRINILDDSRHILARVGHAQNNFAPSYIVTIYASLSTHEVLFPTFRRGDSTMRKQDMVDGSIHCRPQDDLTEHIWQLYGESNE